MHEKLFVSLPRPANKERTTVSPTDGLGETGYPHTGKMKINPYLIPEKKKLTELQRPNMKNPLKLNHNKKKNGPIQIWLKGFKWASLQTSHNQAVSIISQVKTPSFNMLCLKRAASSRQFTEIEPHKNYLWNHAEL